MTRLAYVVLWDLAPADRIERALLVVRRCVSRRESDRVRRRVLKRCVRTRWGSSYRSRAWLEMRPAGADLDPGLADAIRRLSRTGRVAYVLRRVEGLTAEETAAELRRLRVSDADGVARRVLESVDTGTELDPDEQRAAILGLDVDTVAVSPRWSPRRARIRASALLAGALAVVVAGVVLEWPAKKIPLLVNARAGTDLSAVKQWPARGDQVDDRALLGRARDAWAGVPESPDEDGVAYGSVALYGLREVPRPRPGPGSLAVLFAGTVGPGRSVLLSDGDLFALYSEGTSEGRSLTFENGAYGSKGPLSVSPPPHPRGETRTAYLLPPDTARTEVAALSDARPAWRPVTPRDGVISLPEPPDSAGCHRTLFRVSSPSRYVAIPETTWIGTDLDNPVTTTEIDWDAPGEKKTGTAPLDTRLVRDVICDHESFPTLGRQSVRYLTVEPFWHAALPEGHHQGAFVSLGIRYGSAQPDPPLDVPARTGESRTLFVDEPPGATGTAQTVAHEVDSDGDVADTAYATASWHAPSGHWYLVAGGAPAIARMRAWGEKNKKTDGRTLILRMSKKPGWNVDVDAETKSGEPGIPQ
ncbi:hypothetical protein [Actinoallomurus acaciae]|uniref:DNA-directed RNA polymerase specialized sigma24 family protein n=1 Tax=Actinoallomurus acaciae TaxID=502577 RepID=A0ABV5YRL2_9ACTN